jgi:hypothetical protein
MRMKCDNSLAGNEREEMGNEEEERCYKYFLNFFEWALEKANSVENS